MNAIGKILLYLLTVLLCAAVLSPPIYWAFQWLGGQGIAAGLAAFPFHRFFSRILQVSAIILLIPLLFWLRIRSTREFGLEKNPRKWKDLSMGLSLALTPVTILGIAYLVFEIYGIKKDLIPSALPKILLTAVVVAAIEEFLFRGVLLGLAVKAFGRVAGLVSVSLVFAFVHFLKPGKLPVDSVHWWSGFAQFSGVGDGFPAPALFGLGFLSLFIVGLILGFAALRTHSLWLPIGLHAGWVFGQQLLQWLAKFRIKPPDELLPWIGPNVVSGAVPTGLASVLALLVSAAGVWFFLRHERPSVRRPDA